MIQWNVTEILPLLPEITMAVFAMLFIVWGVSRGNKDTSAIALTSVLVCGGAAALILLQPAGEAVSVLNEAFTQTGFTKLVKLMILAGLAATFVLVTTSANQRDLNRFEYPILILLAGVGMMLMVSSNNFLTLYVGLELQSLAAYVLASFRRDTTKSAEAGLKYFVLGALASGLLLFGISLVYGFTGSINYSEIAAFFAASPQLNQAAVVGMAFVLAAIAFKISAVPFHMWTPDVYDGAPTITTAYFALVPKLAAIALLVRLLFDPFAGMEPAWQQIVILLSAASMIWAAFAGLGQTSIKRLLAYSSIGNVGYALIGVVAASTDGIAASMVYLAIYMIMTAGTFAILLAMRRNGEPVETIPELAGLSQTHPFTAYAFAAIMFSLAGIPPLAGFLGKLLIFQSAVATGHIVLAVIGVVASVVSAFYYLRIVKVMFFDKNEERLELDANTGRRLIVAASVVLVLLLLLLPAWLMEVAKTASACIKGC